MSRPVRLVDIGAALGLPRDTHSWDLVTGRINADAVADLVFSDHAQIIVWLNRRPGLEPSWTRPLGDPHGCAVADVDGNGLGDIYCTQGSRQGNGFVTNRLFLQEPEGTWTDRTALYGVGDEFGRGRRTTFADLDHLGGPDLVVGNEFERPDGQDSLNRTFLQADGPPMVRERLGPLDEHGALCLQAVDQNGDGWQDVLLCGGSDQPGEPDPTVPQRLFLFRNRPAPDGGRRLVNVAGQLGIALEPVRSARLARLNGDRLFDLIVVARTRVTIWPGNGQGGFDEPAYVRGLSAGTSVAVGDVDGRRGNDVFVVQGCSQTGNVRDFVLLHAGGFSYREIPAPRVGRGCGDTAATLDIDGDGAAEIVVGNGRWTSRGPLQVLTAGTYRG